MNISVASSSPVAIPIIEKIRNSSHTLVSIISNPDKKTGRGLNVVPNELSKWAEERDLPLTKPSDNSELNRHLHNAQPQIVVTVAYGRLIPVDLLHSPRFGWLNVHFSLLPKWRGAAPVQWAIMNGEKETGISIFRLDKGMDTGPIYYQESTEILETERTPELLNRLSAMGAESILGVINEISTGVRPKPQPNSGISLAPKIAKELGHISWHRTTEEILRLDRAIGDKPGIFSFLKGSRLTLHFLESCAAESSGRPGRILSHPQGMRISTLDGSILVKEVTPAGKKRMSANDYLRGARLPEDVNFDDGN